MTTYRHLAAFLALALVVAALLLAARIDADGWGDLEGDDWV